MSTTKNNIPVILSTGQSIIRFGIFKPLDLILEATQRAIDSAHGIEDYLDELIVVNVLGKVGSHPASLIINKIGLNNVKPYTTTIGGNTPQMLVNILSNKIANGEIKAAVITGGEAMRSSKERRALETQTSDSIFDSLVLDQEADQIIGSDKMGVSEHEIAAGLISPVHVYPLFESAIAHENNRTMEEQRMFISKLFSPFTQIASENEFSWFKDIISPDELYEISPTNRLIAEPYTKRHCAFLGSDQGAAIILASYEVAEKLGLSSQSIFVHSGADLNDTWFTSTRPQLGHSPAIKECVQRTLELGDINVDNINFFDLYSCFPSAVELALDGIGIDSEDRRPLSVTGGLPYFGGPGNNYTTHSIASMHSTLLAKSGFGLVSGLGWYATKHSYGLYGSEPPKNGFRLADTSKKQLEFDNKAVQVRSAQEIENITYGTVLASSVSYNPLGEVSMAPAIIELEDKTRIVANANSSMFKDLSGKNLVSQKVVINKEPLTYEII